MELVIISLGGSIIFPEEIDCDFLREFKTFILESDKKFIIVTGGGKICRKYQSVAAELSNLSDTDLDWIGIASTRMNAEFMKFVLKEVAHDEIAQDPTVHVDFNNKVLMGCGWKPGCSSDMDAILLAETYEATKVINLSNIKYVYDKDPNEFDDAEPQHEMTWAQLRSILPTEWSPGLNVPFDPTAAKKAEELGIEVAVMDGRNIENLKNYLSGDEFEGTVIR